MSKRGRFDHRGHSHHGAAPYRGGANSFSGRGAYDRLDDNPWAQCEARMGFERVVGVIFSPRGGSAEPPRQVSAGTVAHTSAVVGADAAAELEARREALLKSVSVTATAPEGSTALCEEQERRDKL